MIFNIPANIYNEFANIDFSNVQAISTASEDLDDYTDGGVWYFPNDYSPSNKPSGASNYGYLVVISSVSWNAKMQLWIDPPSTRNNIYTRTSATNPVSWGSWSKLITSADTSPKEISVTQVETLPSGVTAINSLVVVQSGNVVTVSVSITRNSTAITSYQKIASGLPVPYKRPMAGTSIIPFGEVHVSGAETGIPLRFSVNSSGELSLVRGGDAGDYLGSFSYIASN